MSAVERKLLQLILEVQLEELELVAGALLKRKGHRWADVNEKVASIRRQYADIDDISNERVDDATFARAFERMWWAADSAIVRDLRMMLNERDRASRSDPQSVPPPVVGDRLAEARRPPVRDGLDRDSELVSFVVRQMVRDAVVDQFGVHHDSPSARVAGSDSAPAAGGPSAKNSTPAAGGLPTHESEEA